MCTNKFLILGLRWYTLVVVLIEGIRVTSSFFFLRKTSKPKNQLRSKNQQNTNPITNKKQLTKRRPTHKQKQTNKTQISEQANKKPPKAASFSCAQKLLRR